jgi:hypothetical protein
MNFSSFGRIGICVAAAALSSGLTAKIASAYRSVSALNCVSDAPSAIAMVNTGQLEAKTTANIYCPVDVDVSGVNAASFDPNSRYATVSVYGWANRNATTWQACMTYSSGGGGECGAIVSAVSSVYYLNVPISIWQDAGIDLLYIQGNLAGPDTGGSFNTFFGYGSNS